MIKLKVLNNADQHFVVSGNEPFRVEVSLYHGLVIAEVYRGDTPNIEDDPIVCFDGGNLTNENWESE